MPINIGAPAIDRASSGGRQITWIALDRPAPYDGLIIYLEIWATTTLLNVKIGSFSRNGDKFTCRDSAHLINVLPGRFQTYSGYNIHVNAGDYIGITFNTGDIELDTSGGAGLYYCAGDQFDTGEQTYTLATGAIMSLGGVVSPTPPTTLNWWALTNAWIDSLYGAIIIHADTSISAHCFIRWSFIKPTRVPIWRTRRGKRILCGYKYSWTNPHLVEQNEPGNTINHSFDVSGLIPSDTVWFYIFSVYGPKDTECQGPLMHAHSATLPSAEPIFEPGPWNTWIKIIGALGPCTYVARIFSIERNVNLVSATIGLCRIGGPYDITGRMQLREDDNGQPSNDIIETSPTIVTQAPGDWLDFTFEFPEKHLISPYKYYWMIFYRTDPGTDIIYTHARFTNGEPGLYNTTGQQPWEEDRAVMHVLLKGTPGPIPKPYDLEIGSPPIDQIYYWPAGDTVIDSSPLRDLEGNPPPHGGTIDKVQIFATEPLSGVRVGTFARNGNQFTSRDYAVIGDVAGGSTQIFTGLNIVVEPGDCLGIYYASGDFDVGPTADKSIFYIAGNQFGTGPQIYTEFTPWAASICGYGWTFP